MKKHFALAAGLAALLSSGALASDLNGSLKDSPSLSGTRINWTGVYIGGQFGYGNTNHKLEESETHGNIGHCAGSSGDTEAACEASVPDNAATADVNEGHVAGTWVPANSSTFSSFIDGLNSHGAFAGGTVGADVQRGNFLVGGFFDYNFNWGKTTVGATGSPDIDVLEEGDSWVAAARLGYLFGEDRRTLLYALGGYGNTEFTYGDQVDKKHKGWVAGAGAEYALNQNLFLGLEYQHFFGKKQTIASESSEMGPYFCTEELTDKIDSDKVMLKLKAKTGFGLPSLD